MSDIVAPLLEDGQEYHCFIAFSSKDEQIVFDLVKFLRDQCKFKVAIYHEFSAGGVLLEAIRHAVDKSQRAIVLLSEAYKKSDYYDHECLLLIHKNAVCKRQLIIPICLGLTEQEMKDTRFGVYNPVYIDYDRDNEEHKRRIAKSLADPPVPLSVSLPCGNVAQGLVWSYYYGYIKLILPGLAKRCRESRWGKDPTIRLIPKVFILIPHSGFCHGSITDCDDRITREEGTLEPVKKTRGGIKDREYKNIIYKIQGSNPDEVYFAPCEYATPVLAMYEMCEEGKAGMTVEEKEHQILQFNHLLDQILSQGMCDEPGEGFVFKIIFFKADEQGKADVSSLIIESIKQTLGQDETAARVEEVKMTE